MDDQFGDVVRQLLQRGIPQEAIDARLSSFRGVARPQIPTDSTSRWKPVPGGDGPCPPGYKRISNIHADGKHVYGTPPKSVCVPIDFNPATSTISFPG